MLPWIRPPHSFEWSQALSEVFSACPNLPKSDKYYRMLASQKSMKSFYHSRNFSLLGLINKDFKWWMFADPRSVFLAWMKIGEHKAHPGLNPGSSGSKLLCNWTHMLPHTMYNQSQAVRKEDKNRGATPTTTENRPVKIPFRKLLLAHYPNTSNGYTPSEPPNTFLSRLNDLSGQRDFR